MSHLHYPTATYLPRRDEGPADIGESPTDVSGLDHSSPQVRTSVLVSQPESTPESNKARSTGGLIITRLLAVLVVAMVVTSILGFTLFDRQGGNSTTALLSLSIGGAAAVLGLILGFREAHQAS